MANPVNAQLGPCDDGNNLRSNPYALAGTKASVPRTGGCTSLWNVARDT